jgi:CheY-like chemotaxis protein
MVFRAQIEHDLPDLHVDMATNGRIAVEEFSRGHHAILVMDLSMPVMDGRQAFEAISRICEERGWEMPSVIFCTGFAPEEFLEKVLQGHPEHSLLLKPVGGTAVVRAIVQRLSHPMS